MSTKIVIKTQGGSESKVWKYFGHAYEGDQLIDSNHVYCKLCFDDGVHTK